MSAAPIGVFDSGVGGLSVLQALRTRLPSERFVYVADSACAPYGDRSAAFVQRRAEKVARFLVQRRVRAMVMACNTASVWAATSLRQRYPLPIVALEPAIKPAALSTRSRVVLVLATASTIRSPAVARLCSAHGGGVRFILQPCPGLADQVERGEFSSAATRRLLLDYLRPGIAQGADAIVLGCTHYVFLAREIASIAGPAVRIVDSGDAVARQLDAVLCGSGPAPRPDAEAVEYHTTGSREALVSFLGTIGERSDAVFPWPDGNDE